MNEETLFEAIGAVENRFLEELDETPVRKLPKHFGLIAAMIALLLTACAAPVVRNLFALQNGSIVPGEADVNIVEQIQEQLGRNDLSVFMPAGNVLYTSRKVTVDVEVSADAPEIIETRYLPVALLNYCQAESWTNSQTTFSVNLSISAPKIGRISEVVYQQHTLRNNGQMEIDGILGSGMWETRTTTIGEITALEIYGQDFLHTEKEDLTVFYRHFFWSDGLYLYCLKIPVVYPLNGEKVEQILTSLTAVEDLSQYLPEQE